MERGERRVASKECYDGTMCFVLLVCVSSIIALCRKVEFCRPPVKTSKKLTTLQHKIPLHTVKCGSFGSGIHFSGSLHLVDQTKIPRRWNFQVNGKVRVDIIYIGVTVGC
jgi:hypothetical protein